METSPSSPTPFANLPPPTLDKIAAFHQELDANFEGVERQAVEEALSLMCEVHADQKDRPDGTPYVEHPLEVAANVLRSLEKPDSEIIIAALLHDSVEDQADKLALKIDGYNISDLSEEVRALLYIETKFGNRVKGIIKSLTNPDFEAELTGTNQAVTTENKNRLYAEHVAAAIEDPDVLPIKLFDFAANGLRLEEVHDPTRRLKLTRKYLPVVGIFIDRLQRGNHDLTQNAQHNLRNQLQNTRIGMQAYLESA